MSQILIHCTNCKKVFSSQINLGNGATAILSGNLSQCPFCGSMEKTPDGTFRGTINGIVEILENSSDKLKTAKELLEVLEEKRIGKDSSIGRNSSKNSKFKKWIPDSPEKLLVYITFLKMLIELLAPNPSLQINQINIVNIYNQVITNSPKGKF